MTKTKEFINDYLLICKNIRNYKLREFEETLNIQEGLFDSNLKCPLAYTTIGEEENIEVQVTLDGSVAKLKLYAHLYKTIKANIVLTVKSFVSINYFSFFSINIT